MCIWYVYYQLFTEESEVLYKSVFNLTRKILAVSYREVPHIIPAKYQPNWSSGSAEEVV